MWHVFGTAASLFVHGIDAPAGQPYLPVMTELKTLADFTKPHMVLNCLACGRKGRYNVARLIEKHGPDMPIRDFIDLIGQSCPKWVHPQKWESCGLGCNDLIYMFSPLPGVDGYADKRDK